MNFRRIQRYGSLILLAACIAASLVFRRFVFIAWYPVVMSAALAVSFGVSLLTRPLCLVFAEELPPHFLPDGAEEYCRKLTVVWCLVFVFNGLVATTTVFSPRWVWILWNCALSYLQTALVIGIEWFIRRRRFAKTFHTSGSTGTPKRIVKSFDKLAKEVIFHRDRLKDALAGKPLFLATVDPNHMYGLLWHDLLPRAAGCPRCVDVLMTPEELLEKMRSAEKVFFVTTPSFLVRFCAYAEQYDVPRNCVELVTSGALLTPEVSAAAARIFGVVPREIFGSTETGGVAERRQVSPDCCWTVFEPVRVSAEGEEKRIAVESPFSVERRYVMGDGVELSPDGRSFRLLGRRDRLVKIAEERVSLPEMEEKMRSLEGVREVALVALEGEKGEYLAALVAGERRAPLEMRRLCLPLFPRGTVPRRFRFVAELPRNTQGKVVASEVRKALL